MKSYNIAVCLSGEPRTWQKTAANINRFFGSNKHNVVFFGHTWTHSFYNKENRKYPDRDWNERYDESELRSAMMGHFNFADLEIQDKNVITLYRVEDKVYQDVETTFGKHHAANRKVPDVWKHMSYSIMRSNALKQKYELENNMIFDVAIRSRYDIVYHPELRFDSVLEKTGPIIPIALYADTHYFPSEFSLPNLNDIFYYGSSRVMNIVDGFYRYFGNGKFWDMLDENWNDCALKQCGYNVNLYKWVTMKNILIKNVMHPGDMQVIRKTHLDADIDGEWNNLIEFDRKLLT